MKLTFEINGVEIEKNEALTRFLQKIGYIIEASIVEKITQLGLVKTGRFRGSIHSYMKGDTLIIADNVDYGKYLEFGTTAHMVRPKNKKALHWKEGGKDRFSKGHVVSGIKVYAPFRRGLVSSIPRIREAFNG